MYILDVSVKCSTKNLFHLLSAKIPNLAIQSPHSNFSILKFYDYVKPLTALG